MRIDHVISATADLDAAAARVEAELGVAAVAGGRHERLGTHNRIVPLGGGYLELLAVADPEEAASSNLGRAVHGRIAQEGEGLLGWAVAVDNVRPVAARLGTSITTIKRQGLSATLTGVAEALREPSCLSSSAVKRGCRSAARPVTRGASRGSSSPAIGPGSRGGSATRAAGAGGERAYGRSASGTASFGRSSPARSDSACACIRRPAAVTRPT